MWVRPRTHVLARYNPLADAGRDLPHRPYLPCLRGMRFNEFIVEEAKRNAEERLRPSSQLPPEMAHSPAPPAASAPLGSPPDSAASVPSNTLATLAASEELGESSDESGEWSGCVSDGSIEACPSPKQQNVNMYADNNSVVRKNLLGCKKDPGRCSRSLFSSEVYPATTVVHFAARRRGLARTLSCSLARYSRQTT